MFFELRVKLERRLDDVGKWYARRMLRYTHFFILFYVTLSLLLGVGVWRLRFNSDTEHLTNVRHSRSLRDMQTINHTFSFDQYERHFSNKLLDLGYFFEFIVLARAPPGQSERTSNDDLLRPEYNVINETILAEYNDLFDSIATLYIEDVVDDNNSTTITTTTPPLTTTTTNNSSSSSSSSSSTHKPIALRNYTYMQDLCARRLKKCSIEGGLVRNENVQKTMLSSGITYKDKDPKSSFGDTTVSDGFSVNVLFGKYRREVLQVQSSDEPDDIMGNGYAIVHASALRNRFDMLATTETERRRSVRFMQRFAAHMEEQVAKNRWPHLNVSFYTSHTLQDEIARYSVGDVSLVMSTFVCFWLTLLLVMWLYSTLNIGTSRSPHTCFVLDMGRILLPLGILAQFSLTILASFGLLAILGIQLNPFALLAVFILMVNGCKQAFILYASMTDLVRLESKTVRGRHRGGSRSTTPGHSSNNNNNNNNNNNDANNNNNNSGQYTHRTNSSLKYHINIEMYVARMWHIFFVPLLFSLATTILTYKIVGLTNCFDSIRTLCLLVVIVLSLNTVGVFAFYFPCIVLYLKGLNRNDKCQIVKCLNENSMTMLDAESADCQETSVVFKVTNEDDDDEDDEDDDGNDNDVDDDGNGSMGKIETMKRASSTIDIVIGDDGGLVSAAATAAAAASGHHNGNWIDMIIYSNIKYVIVIVFVAYFVFNATVLQVNYKANLSAADLIPRPSYLRKHLINHFQLFDIGPIIMIAFMKPIDYWNRTTFTAIRSLLDDIHSLKSVEPRFEMNWLQDWYFWALRNKELAFFKECEDDPMAFGCFRTGFLEVVPTDMYVDDVNYASFANDTLLINSSRVYLQFENFFGNQDEVAAMHKIGELVYDKYKFDTSTIVYSAVYPILEQLDELPSTLLSLVMLTVESMVLVGLVFLVELRTIVLLSLMALSLFLSVVSNVFLFGMSLNIVVLVNLCMLPAFVCEFFTSPAYVYLYFRTNKTVATAAVAAANAAINASSPPATPATQMTVAAACSSRSSVAAATSVAATPAEAAAATITKTTADCTSNPHHDIITIAADSEKHQEHQEQQQQQQRVVRIRHAARQAKTAAVDLGKLNFIWINLNFHSTLFLIVLLLNLLIAMFCQTYSMWSLSFVLISSAFNLLLHVHIFFPTLLCFFATY